MIGVDDVASQTRSEYRSIVLLCQECGGDLVCTKRMMFGVRGEVPVWICSRCKLPWVWTDGGWMRQDY